MRERRRHGGRGGGSGVARRGLRFLRRRRAVVAWLVVWSVVEAAHTFGLGYALARALDSGFLAGRAGAGLGWLGAAAAAVVVGAYGTGRTYDGVAGLVEPLRDGLVRRVVPAALRDADGAAVSRLTHQVEIARDAFAGLVMVSRSFVFTAAGALTGLFLLAPALLVVVVPPLVLGLGLFLATLRPLARRQETFLVADETLARSFGEVSAGLRDITAGGAEGRVRDATGALVDAERRASVALARWSVVRVAALAVAGQLPVVLLLAATPWLLDRSVTPGALVGALAYLTQSLLPALQNLVHGLGASGSRLTVVLRRLTATPQPAPGAHPGAGHPAPTPGPRPAGGHAALAPPAVVGLGGPTATPPPAPGPHPTDGHPPPAPGPRPMSGHSAPVPGPRPTSEHPSPPPPTPAVELRGVTFAYGEHADPVVDALDLVVPTGSHLAVVGPSGVGKSTLAGLMAGLLAPRSGEVRVGGRPPGDPGGRVLIPQEAYVFSGTLGDNLRYLRPDPVGERELADAAEALGMSGLVARLGGFGTPLAPDTLSAGERQQIALARAYLSPAPVALLDEATCHLDPAAEARAERAFARRPGTTLIVIAHRAASARRADRVLVMDGPRTRCGDHRELLAVSPLYRDLTGAPGPRTPAHAPSHPPRSPRDPDRVDAVAGPGLPGDRRQVVAHGPVGKVQTPGDLPDGGALRGE
ncbi:ATP-binding cassette domain-containing protein [Streptomyces albireticuli]|nr:ABC transporter ATP-binding protein [Streptomyces albireticuli]MCD9141961.1 ABC transporter ATP-binding protein/permease [Streptomyces albireticuli]MCD9163095.1 ABC transporter ATP-binding protein/permease [Streptomyces albireticuli]MCD9190135.1 ABC transporter ATP-binding protein/permease [Streptomyces albireticuli]